MKILQVMAGAEHGGAETAFVDMCLALHEAGETIRVVTRKNDLRVPALQAAGIPVDTLLFGGRLDVFTTWRLQKIIAAFQPHIIQTWMSRAAARTPRWNAGMNIPRYLVVSRLGGYYKLKYFQSADYFTTITPDIKRYLAEQGVRPDIIRHINNFAETEAVSAPASRADYGVPADAPLLVALGRLHESKAFDTLIRAVAGVPGVHLWIAGEGPARAALEGLIRKEGVEHRVKLLGWRDDRAALLQAADVCVFPSRYEPFGTVFVQAWAQQRPLIASMADGPRQFVRDGEDGLLFPVDDIDSLKEKIKSLINNEKIAKKLAKNGYERYKAEFTKDKALREYLGWYHEIRTREGLSD